MAQKLPSSGPERTRDLDVLLVDGLGRLHRADGQRRERREKQQRNLRKISDAEPHHQERVERQGRERPIELDQGIEDRAESGAEPHEQAQGQADEAREKVPGEHSSQARFEMLMQ